MNIDIYHIDIIEPLEPGIYQGVPNAPLTIDEVMTRRHVCFSPDELKAILDRMRGRIPITVKGEDIVDVAKINFDRVLTVRVDKATEYFINQLELKYRLSRTEILRLGIYLLKEILDKQMS